jgi:hypothetical protein
LGFNMNEKRKFDKTRQLVAELEKNGWVMVSRNPPKLERGNGTAEVKPNGIVVYGTKDRGAVV